MILKVFSNLCESKMQGVIQGYGGISWFNILWFLTGQKQRSVKTLEVFLITLAVIQIPVDHGFKF